MKDRFRILSLAGGGVRGVFSAAVLCELNDALRARTGDPAARLVDQFDLIVGTSTGGLLGLGLAFGKAPQDLLTIYNEHAGKIFPPWWKNPRVLRLGPLLWPLYSPEPLRAAIAQMIPSGKLLGDASLPVVLTAVRRESGAITCLKTRHHETFYRDHQMCAVEAGLATAAAPVAFPCVRTAQHGDLLDGGLYANAPILVGIIEAMRFFGQRPETIEVLSIGTTSTKLARRSRWHLGGVAEYGGMLRGRMQDLLWKGQQSLALQAAKLLLSPERVHHLDHEFAGHGFSMMDASKDALRALEQAGREEGQRAAAGVWARLKSG